MAPFERIAVSERAMPPTPESLHDPVPAEEFSDRFAQILALGTRIWVNLACGGVTDNTLHVIVEYPSEVIDGDRPSPAEKMFVNFSGPAITGAALDELIRGYTTPGDAPTAD
jgi:hypothetical protein